MVLQMFPRIIKMLVGLSCLNISLTTNLQFIFGVNEMIALSQSAVN